MNKRLIEPGWAGEINLEEAKYIQSELHKDNKLRKLWRIRGKGTIPLTKIAERAYPEDPETGRDVIRRAMSRGRHSRQNLSKTNATT
ncbi:hypothetical protein ACFLTS_05150 [Chloroflexota bacterium]